MTKQQVGGWSLRLFSSSQTLTSPGVEVKLGRTFVIQLSRFNSLKRFFQVSEKLPFMSATQKTHENKKYTGHRCPNEGAYTQHLTSVARFCWASQLPWTVAVKRTKIENLIQTEQIARAYNLNLASPSPSVYCSCSSVRARPHQEELGSFLVIRVITKSSFSGAQPWPLSDCALSHPPKDLRWTTAW